jgi:hypothetical protein
MTQTDQAVAVALIAYNDPEVRRAATIQSSIFARMRGRAEAGLRDVERLKRERMAGRVPSQDIFADATGYMPGISHEVMK